MVSKSILDAGKLTREYLSSVWKNRTAFCRVKGTEWNIRQSLLRIDHDKMPQSPQEIQGMWQAYGQIRAARVTARGAVIATGFIGTGLWAYQQKVQQGVKELVKEQETLSEEQGEFAEKRGELVKKQEEQTKEMLSRYDLHQKFLEAVEKRMQQACKKDKKCWEDYVKEKQSILSK